MLHAVKEPVPSREWQRSVHSQNLRVNLQTAQTLYAVSRLCGIMCNLKIVCTVSRFHFPGILISCCLHTGVSVQS